MSESIFERLYREENSSVMNINYRMNKEITALANEITYNGELLIGSDDVSKATIKIPNKQVFTIFVKYYSHLIFINHFLRLITT